MLNSLVVPPCCRWGNPDVSCPLVFLSEHPSLQSLILMHQWTVGRLLRASWERPMGPYAACLLSPARTSSEFQEQFPKSIFKELFCCCCCSVKNPFSVFPSIPQSWAPILYFFSHFQLTSLYSQIVSPCSQVSAIHHITTQAILRPYGCKG